MRFRATLHEKDGDKVIGVVETDSWSILTHQMRSWWESIDVRRNGDWSDPADFKVILEFGTNVK